MNHNNNNLTVLLYMQKYCLEIDEVFSEYGKDFDIFQNYSIYRNAISMSLFQIGELTNHLTPVFLSSTSNEINWFEIMNMRNCIIQSYQETNLNDIYDVAINDIPILKEFLKINIEKMQEDDAGNSDKSDDYELEER